MTHFKAEKIIGQIKSMQIDASSVREAAALIDDGTFGDGDVISLYQATVDSAPHLNDYSFERAEFALSIDALCASLQNTGFVKPNHALLEKLIGANCTKSIASFASNPAFEPDKQSIGIQLLHVSISQKRSEAVKLLVEGGVDVNGRDPKFPERDPILYNAINRGNWDIFKTLLDAGLDIHAESRFRDKAISRCAGKVFEIRDQDLALSSGILKIMCTLMRLGAPTSSDLEATIEKQLKERGWNAVEGRLAAAMAEFDASALNADTPAPIARSPERARRI